jgi:hypothetical protein
MAQAAKKTEAEAPRKIRLKSGGLKLLGQDLNIYSCKLDMGHRFEDTANPDYWANDARRIKKGTLIFATAYDDSFAAMFWVYDAGPTWLRVRTMLHQNFAGEEKLSSDTSLYTVDKVDNGWRVFHKESKSLLATGLDSEIAAQNFVKQITKT